MMHAGCILHANMSGIGLHVVLCMGVLYCYVFQVMYWMIGKHSHHVWHVLVLYA